MQKSIIYIVFLIFWMASPAPAQTGQSVLQKIVSLQLNNETIAAGLQELQRHHQVYFSYVNQPEHLQQEKSLKLQQVTLDSVLTELFRHTNITFYDLYDQVVLIEKELAARYRFDVIDSMQNNPDTIRVFNITYLHENARESKMSVADLWRALMLQSVIEQSDSGITWVRYDTLANPDTVRIMIDSVRSKPQKLKVALKATENKWQHSLIFRPDFMVTRWQMSSTTIEAGALNDINDYGNPEISISAGLLYTLRYRLLSLQTGLELNLIKRETRHQETLINRLNNNAESTRFDRNASQYNYVGIPLLAGVNLGWQNMYFRLSGGVQFNLLSSSAGAVFYPVYETIYYDNTLNLLYDADNNLLENQEIQLRRSFASLRLQLMSFFQMDEHFYLTGGFIYRQNNQSIYQDSAPVEEVFSGIALSVGLSYLF